MREQATRLAQVFSVFKVAKEAAPVYSFGNPAAKQQQSRRIPAVKVAAGAR
jgi:hypothetical protein